MLRLNKCSVIAAFCLGCGFQTQAETSLQPAASYRIAVPEPSGLALDAGGQTLWTVSDASRRIYKISLTGETVDTLSYVGTDLEGITQDSRDHTIWVAEERRREIVQLDTTGQERNRVKINIEQGEANKGLEGISIDPESGHLFVLNEQSPDVLVELDEHYQIVREFKLTFAKDYSGVVFDSKRQGFWIVSDESRSVTFCDLQAQPRQTFSLDIRKPEGVALSSDGQRLFVVSDSEAKLYVFDLSDLKLE